MKHYITNAKETHVLFTQRQNVLQGTAQQFRYYGGHNIIIIETSRQPELWVLSSACETVRRIHINLGCICHRHRWQWRRRQRPRSAYNSERLSLQRRWANCFVPANPRVGQRFPENCCPFFGKPLGPLGDSLAQNRCSHWSYFFFPFNYIAHPTSPAIHRRRHSRPTSRIYLWQTADGFTAKIPAFVSMSRGRYLQTTDCLNLGYLEQDVRIHRSFSSYRSTTFPAHHAIVVVWAYCILQSGEQCYLFLFP